MNDLFSDSTKVDSRLDDLFKSSAGKSEIAVKPILAKDIIARATKQASKQKKAQEKKGAKDAFLGFKKAQELIANVNKRKAEESEGKDTKKVKKVVLTPEQKAEKELRTVFLGNVPVEVIEKEGYRQLKSTFKECGKIESIRFRSVAFSEPMDRKSAFISRKLHSSRDVLNAYIVFDNKAAADKAAKLNGMVFMDKHLRVDGASNDKQHDRKRSIFLGGLPFDTEEEELWEFFTDCGDIESVRIVRDNKTNVGKGFGYVQFTDRECVDVALALSDKKLRDNTKIRIQRCKIPVSEGGARDIRKKGGSKPNGARKQSGKSGKPILTAKKFEGTRATRDDKKFKIKSSKKKIGKK